MAKVLFDRKKFINKMDKLWSLKVREVGICELCSRKGDIKSFDAHHLRGRGNQSTRWDLDNGVCLCKGCHRFKVHMDTFTTGILIKKLEKKRGDGWWKRIERKSNQSLYYTNKDLEEIYGHLQD